MPLQALKERREGLLALPSPLLGPVSDELPQRGPHPVDVPGQNLGVSRRDDFLICHIRRQPEDLRVFDDEPQVFDYEFFIFVGRLRFHRGRRNQLIFEIRSTMQLLPAQGAEHGVYEYLVHSECVYHLRHPRRRLLDQQRPVVRREQLERPVDPLRVYRRIVFVRQVRVHHVDEVLVLLSRLGREPVHTSTPMVSSLPSSALGKLPPGSMPHPSSRSALPVLRLRDVANKAADGLYVGNLWAANHLYDDLRLPLSKRPPPGFESFGIVSQIKGVISVCNDFPNWCNKFAECFHRGNAHESGSLSHLMQSPNFDRDYVDLHVDRIPHYREQADSSSSSDEPRHTYVLHMFINAQDTGTESLFRAFPITYDFVEAVKAIDNGSTFIHCHMGISRSCSLVCSYLMKKRDLPFTTVLRRLRRRHPIAFPGEGFQCQLVLYYQYGFTIPNRTLFWTECQKLLRHIDFDNLQQYEQRRELPDEESESNAVYSCMKCRQTLFYGGNVLPHDTAALRYGGSEKCSSVFVEPMDWMTNVETQSGKILCKNARCSAKLGFYCWYGRRCSCGHLQVPAFQIQLSKVDKLESESCRGGATPIRNEKLL
ncbi:dual-specificity phosphatase [Babesia caballi]|uniref:protein-tyrosine-phosphatase n=1 Tax=Babesia caballi TaxID=5871 RepID=A0AAV4LL22_BABCB|nr:dual-specificity phosphatase [Babesia caballi]